MSTIKALTDPEIEELLRWIRPENFYSMPDYKSTRLKLAVLLMIEAGLRIGELVLLHWSDLILISLPAQILRLRAEITKTKYPRDIPTTQRLRDQIERCYKLYGQSLHTQNIHYVFTSSDRTSHLTTRHLSRSIKNASLKAIGRPVTAHCLRHTFATRLLRHTSTRVVQELLGHKSLQSTQIYTHPNSQDLKKAIDHL